MAGKKKLPTEIREANAQRQRAFRERCAAAGLKTIVLVVPIELIEDFKLAAQDACAAKRESLGQSGKSRN